MQQQGGGGHIDIYILYRQRRQEDELPLPHCQKNNNVHLMVEPVALPDDRIDRLAVLRNRLRDEVLQQQAGRRPPYDVVMVLDLDLYRIPTVEQLQHGLELVWNSSGSSSSAGDDDDDNNNNSAALLDIACANGYEVMAGMPQPYDLYAMIEASGEFRYGAEGLTPYWYATLQQPRLFQRIVRGRSSVYPVRSCFAGVALYKASVYFDERCSYTTQPVSLDRFALDGKVCEHVVLHECLRHYRRGGDTLRVAIVPTMPVQRACEAACQALGFSYRMTVYGGSIAVILVAMRWKQQWVHPRRSAAAAAAAGKVL